ncbi:C6 zinc finger domain protein [Colletotrichum karsti]|uniref:C6 zinc finger domain protein n=1 Tax=Colletotrichum karsti TaxID=1095194 RepID=A0A9P6HYI3_9PEZI|nr:C6 zinc finger domain protein [Colletotrichum karsti]KAF9871451.1 C6 zinc finger domain protein [Colletotrichum karsti]
MARKGSRKVRTGCYTCKVRKVKCDETKPKCLKCANTGRRCDGYPAPLGSELRPLQPQAISIFPGVNSQIENRAIQFFCEMAGPNLPGATDPFFWTHLVMQFSRFEPAVRHSLIAISSLYEDVSQTRTTPTWQRSHTLQDNNLALTHYNSAIKEIVNMEDQGLVLLVCVLFICIELLQLNREAALRHCTHGTAILKSFENTSYHWVREWLTPLFRRLTTLHYFFGDRVELPDLSTLSIEPPTLFSDFNEAEAMVDDIFNQSFQLIRRGYPYRTGDKRHHQPTSDLVKEQKSIQHRLDRWYTMFTNLDNRSTSPEDMIRGIPRVFALARYRVSRIWSAMALNPSEMDYDNFEDDFRQLVQELSEWADERIKYRSRNNFEFEMGFIPLISFIVMKCRYLDLRVEALNCLKVLAAPREALWQKDGMYALTRRIIEVEHGLSLDASGRLDSDVDPTYPGLPPEEVRVAHVVTEFLGARDNEFYGNEVCGKKVVFLLRGPGDQVVFRPDVLENEPAVPLPAWSPATTEEEVMSQ